MKATLTLLAYNSDSKANKREMLRVNVGNMATCRQATKVSLDLVTNSVTFQMRLIVQPAKNWVHRVSFR
jgi:hypothetical protein